MTAIAIPNTNILIPRLEFPAWLRRRGAKEERVMNQIAAGGIRGGINAGAVGVASAVVASAELPYTTGLRWDINFIDITKLFQDTARTTPVTTAGQFIKGVTDCSPVENHPSQNTNPPTYRASGFGTGSAPYAEFDGVNDRLNTATNPVYGETEWTIYLAYRSRETGTSNLSPILHGEYGDVKAFSIYDVHETTASLNDDSIGMVGGNGNVNHVRGSLANSVPPNTETLAMVAWKDGTNPPVVMRVNGISQTPLGGVGSGAFAIVWAAADAGLSISANPPGSYIANTAAKIDVARILIYQGQHTSTEWEQIEPYLATYCGISL